MGSEIEIRKVSHSFGDKQVLSDVNMHINKGEIIGLLGPSGAGKTTLVNIITGQLAPDEGSVYLYGKRVKAGRQDLSHIGVMMDNWGFYERLTVFYNLKFYANLYGIPVKKIDEVLEKTEMSQAKKSLVSNLSKGMKSRINLCRALLKDIDLLFLDEPTSGLDPATTKEIHKIILEQKAKGTTIFLTTHNMFEAQELCDNVALLNQGRIVEYGAPEEICRKYNHLNKIIVRVKNGEIIELNNDIDGADTIRRLMETEGISTIHSSEPDLEKVFLELTGRGLE